MKVDANGSFQLSESELNQLIQRVENGGDKFRVSLTDAFFQRPYDRTRSEGNMNDALRGFKKATDQVRIRFDARQLVTDDIRRLLDQATPLDIFMRDNPLTDPVKSDWSTLREDLSVLASAYDVAPSWGNSPILVSSNGYKENDFNVTFDASDNNRGLRVRRQIYSDRLPQPVVVDSVYDRTADVAQWGIYNDFAAKRARQGIN
jgi:hypothetical protein